MKREKQKLYYVEWCDAITCNDGWEDKKTIMDWGKKEEWIIRQVGFLIEDNKKYILLASKYNPQMYSEEKFAEITKIPKTWIRTKKKITIFS